MNGNPVSYTSWNWSVASRDLSAQRATGQPCWPSLEPAARKRLCLAPDARDTSPASHGRLRRWRGWLRCGGEEERQKFKGPYIPRRARRLEITQKRVMLEPSGAFPARTTKSSTLPTYLLPDQSVIALATNPEDIRLVSVSEAGSEAIAGDGVNYFVNDVALLEGHEDILMSLDFDWSVGHWVASGAEDNTARLWRVDLANNSDTCYATFTGHIESVGAVALPNVSSQHHQYFPQERKISCLPEGPMKQAMAPTQPPSHVKANKSRQNSNRHSPGREKGHSTLVSPLQTPEASSSSAPIDEMLFPYMGTTHETAQPPIEPSTHQLYQAPTFGPCLGYSLEQDLTNYWGYGQISALPVDQINNLTPALHEPPNPEGPMKRAITWTEPQTQVEANKSRQDSNRHSPARKKGPGPRNREAYRAYHRAVGRRHREKEWKERERLEAATKDLERANANLVTRARALMEERLALREELHQHTWMCNDERIVNYLAATVRPTLVCLLA
ncbi:hypothetical protein B0T18DRAFT_16930 [Schizothecium vesticola]|uniref:BZIP domain-containing protein n=1 Tax=Schizothecium vesticola TaxID=314040 RepID=A0AA40F962_9PEZI|nr:hypothetical protein B0T18DRAFT_16930 [Schizothecium vesticola]